MLTGLAVALSATWLVRAAACKYRANIARTSRPAPPPMAHGTRRLREALPLISSPAAGKDALADGAADGGPRARDVELTDRQLELGVGEERLGVRQLHAGAEAGAQAGVGLRLVGLRGAERFEEAG